MSSGVEEEILAQICSGCLSRRADAVTRCSIGLANYVYLLEAGGTRYILRCSKEKGAYQDTVRWLEKLAAVGVPVPAVLGRGTVSGYEYLLLSYLEGEDLSEAYPHLTAEDKRVIAKEVIQIQRRAGTLDAGALESDWSWKVFVDGVLAQAWDRIIRNGYFDAEKVDRLSEAAMQLERYFADVRPTVYLDDITTKNLLIHNGRVSGVIDVDWMGVGDILTFAALTNMALLNLGYDTDYVQYLLEELRPGEDGQRAFLFYTLMFCVDFMGERGTRFLDKTVAVNREIVDRLNAIYDRLWAEWIL